jgi:hypothetical protein
MTFWSKDGWVSPKGPIPWGLSVLIPCSPPGIKVETEKSTGLENRSNQGACVPRVVPIVPTLAAGRKQPLGFSVLKMSLGWVW